MGERSLLSVADRVVQLETAVPVTPRPRIRLGASFDRLGVPTGFFEPRAHSTDVRLHELSDVTLHGKLMIVLKDLDPVSETKYCVDPSEWRVAPRELSPEQAMLIPPDVRIVIGSNRSYLNYYHWITQAVPAIDQGLSAPSDLPLCLALPETRLKLHGETLRLLGHASVGLLNVSASAGYQIPFARYCDFLTGLTAFEVSYAAQRTFRKLAASVRDVPTGHDILYVARTDARSRPMLNEGALIDLLRSRGVSIVQSGELTMALQINLFRNARAVIGAQGSGLTNIAFCRPGTVVYELLPSAYPNARFNVLAQAGNLDYIADVFSRADQPAGKEAAAWNVDLDVVERRLADLPRAAPLLFAPPRSLAAPIRTAAANGSPSGAVRVGIAVATFNRRETMLGTLERIRAFTGQPYEFVVVDDGSKDGTAESLRSAGVPVISGRNMGVAWNKNRALFYLATERACDVMIVLEDDTRPSEQNWQERWISAALKWGHVNIAGEWFRDSFVSGDGTAEDPILCGDLSAQCSAFTRECLAVGGYMDPRFRGFGFEHVEHTWRLARHGFGGSLNIASGAAAPLFKLISGGLEVLHGNSAGNSDDIERNRDLCHRIMWDEHFRLPWSDQAEMTQFREELASADAQSPR